MSDFASRIGPGPQIALRGMDSAPAAAPAVDTKAPAVDTQARRGLGALSGHLVAVGDGQTGQRLQDAGASKALLASTSTAVKTMLADGATGPAANGIQPLKERQLGNGDGQGTSLLQKVGAALRRVLSGLSDLLKSLVQAPAARSKAATGNAAPTALNPAAALAFEKSVTSLHNNLASAPLFEGKPMNRWFAEKLPAAMPAPRGIHDQAVRDWSGEGVTIAGKPYAGNVAGVTQAVGKLIALCGGNEASAEWISRFANQQALGAISTNTPELALGPNGEKGYMFTGGRPQYEMKALEGGSIELTIRYQWSSDQGDLIHDLEPLDDPGVIGAKFEFSYGLKFDLPQDPGSLACPQVSLSQAFQCKAS